MLFVIREIIMDKKSIARKLKAEIYKLLMEAKSE
jgi:hypothetical protein